MTLTLTSMLLGIGVAAAVVFFLQMMITKEYKHYIIRYFQAFVGSLLIFSGVVKVLDPLGTAYKMEQYFASFETLFDGTFLSFMGSVFPLLKDFAVSFSVFMIVFEIILGFMILTGIYKKFATWALFFMMIFFTILTGYTYLTGFVPSDGTFFDFSSWGAFKTSNMQVTDCGCFGDFLKLEPKTSFFKDIFFLIPTISFLFFRNRMYTLINSSKVAMVSTVALTLGTLIYAFSNFVWDIPHVDFRPFQEGVDLRTEKSIQEEAAGNVQVTGFLLKNKKEPSRTVELTMAEYTSNYAQYSEEWEVVDQLKTEPTMELTKISEFELSDSFGNPATEEFLAKEGKSIVILSQAMKGHAEYSKKNTVDSIVIFDAESGEESLKIVNNEIDVVDYIAEGVYAKSFKDIIVPFTEKARAAGYSIDFIAAGSSVPEVQDFAKDVGFDANIYTADDILIKTIIRSNPGIMIMDNGVITKKYHIRKLPPFEDLPN